MTTATRKASERMMQTVLAELENQADLDGIVIAVQGEIADACGISIVSVSSAIAGLIAERLVVHEGYYNIPGMRPSNPNAVYGQGHGRLAILRLADTG